MTVYSPRSTCDPIPTESPVPLGSVLTTNLLDRRPCRPPDYEVENSALLTLAEDLAQSPKHILQKLVDTALRVCRAHSAGISLLEEDGGKKIFRWHATAGAYAPYSWATTPRESSPCGTVLDQNAALLFSNLALHFTPFASVTPWIVEALLAPFHVGGEAVGTVWVIAHDGARRFDAEDMRLVSRLARFAANAYQVLSSMDALTVRTGELEAADRRKDEFLAVLSHELRNPLAAASNAVQTLRTQAATVPSESATAIRTLDRQVGQLTRLADDILDVARIGRGGRLDLRMEVVDIATALQDAAEANRPLRERLGHGLMMTLPTRPIFLVADTARLTQLFLNLLSNAAKYTDPGGSIRLTAARDGAHVVVTVADTGIGIAADVLPRVFDQFMQVDSSLERAQGGLGIGLALARTLAELHGGSIEAMSRGLGLGSEFVVRLPLAPATALTRPAPQPARSLPAPTPRRILVVDDNTDAAESLAAWLRLLGHEVYTAHDGPAALDAATKFAPSLVLLDIRLPHLSGYEVARRLRAQEWRQPLTLVALTGLGAEEDLRRAQEAGFDFHLLKPIRPARLEEIIAS